MYTILKNIIFSIIFFAYFETDFVVDSTTRYALSRPAWGLI